VSHASRPTQPLLAPGCGTDGRHLSTGCTAGATASVTSLWVTPGVRGLWVEGGDVTCGEMLQLLSTPQVPTVAHEGDEGLFVRVRRALEHGGHEGWAKLKNIHALPETHPPPVSGGAPEPELEPA
jgi:hypothetical protein